MNIDKALEHFNYKFKNHWKPSKTDIEAFNSILEWKEEQENKVMQDNESLCKLWIEKMILLSRTKLYDGKASIKVINEILSKSTYEWCEILNNEIPMIRFNSVGLHKYPVEEKDVYNMTKLQERNTKIIEEYETDLTKAIKTEPKLNDTIKLVNSEINKIINKFEK